MERKKWRLFAWAAVPYAALSAVALLPDAWQPAFGIVGQAITGPPSLLGWGMKALPLYLGVTAVLGGLLWAAIVRPHEVGPFATIAALAIWVGVGWLATAMSI